jgi:hypothetical protein
VNDSSTQELPIAHVEQSRQRARGVGAMWRGLTGALAAGLVLLALGVLGVQIYAYTQHLPGPGGVAVTGHLVAAVLAVVCQRIADRSSGWRSALGVLAVLVITSATLWLFWWA